MNFSKFSFNRLYVLLHSMDNRKIFSKKFNKKRWFLFIAVGLCGLSQAGWDLQARELGFQQYRENVLKEVDEYQEALKKDPSNAKTHFQLGLSYMALGRHEDEIAKYLDAIRLEPDFADAHFNLAQAYDLLGDGVRSIKHMLRARQIYAAHRNHRGIRTSQRLLRALYEKYDHRPGD